MLHYAFFAEDYPLGLDFCLTFVRGPGPDEVITRLGGREPVDLVGSHRVVEASDLVPMRPDADEDGVLHADRTTGLTFVAAAAAGEWTIVVEHNGFLCTEEPAVRALSHGGEMVTYFRSEHSDDRFFHARDGRILVDFDPTGAGWRTGSEPDRLTGTLERLGFDLGTEEIDPSDPRWRYDEHNQERTLALLEHLTGVRLTAGFLETAVFRCAAVPDPDGWAWVTADPAHTAPFTPDGLATDVRAALRAFAAKPDGDDW